MILTHHERRRFPRMTIRYRVMFKRADQEDYEEGAGHNLSANGILFHALRALEVGEEFEVRILPERQITPPLEARMCVIRAGTGPDHSFEIAGRIDRIRD